MRLARRSMDGRRWFGLVLLGALAACGGEEAGSPSSGSDANNASSNNADSNNAGSNNADTSGANNAADNSGDPTNNSNNSAANNGDNNADNSGNNADNSGNNADNSGNNSGPDDNNNSAPPEACVSDEQFFLREVWTPVLSRVCFNCHNPLGQAASSEMVYESAGQLGFESRNLAVFANVAAYERDGVSVMLLKPTGRADHGGGPQIALDGDEYRALEAMLARLEAPTECPPAAQDDSFLEGVELLTPAQTYRKATLHLAGRLPDAVELEQIEAGGEQALEAALDRLLREDAFYERMEELFNDALLTDKYVGRTRALDLLERDVFPAARWYDDANYDRRGEDPAFISAAARHSNDSVAREPLKLVTYLLRHDRPFTELLTADYAVVNPYVAKVYGVEGLTWEDPLDPNEWQPARIPGVPHAGILSSPMFLNRFPTTDTNRNRHRARVVFDLFLATDVLKLGERPIDPTSAAHNPTMNDPQCAGCHSIIDPVAGTMQAFNARGSYDLPEAWYGDMRQPGYGREVMPSDERPQAHRWLAQKIVDDPRFGRAMVHLMFEGLTGQEPLSLPVVEQAAGDHAALLAAYEHQQQTFDRYAKNFSANGADLRVVLKDLVRSPWFRAANAAAPLDEGRASQLASFGTGRLLTPEALNRKIFAVLGQPWRPRANEGDYLLREDYYRILYGGIDSDDVVGRITEPNGIMSAIQTRMANELACLIVPQDFARPKAQRRLFGEVEPSYLLQDSNGFEVPQAIEATRRNIQHLHWLLLGEELADDDPELDRTYALYEETWREGMELRASGQISQDLHWACQAREDFWTGADYPEAQAVRRDPNYTIRAWMAVVTYLLLDHKFLYE